MTLYDYDWRRDLLELATQLALCLREHGDTQIALIGHSMGGLLARATLRLPGAERVCRVVTLGTPHLGSIAAAQALRATYPVICRLAAIDAHHSAEYLTEAVFRHFPSLYQLLPPPGASGPIDVFDPSHWPRTGPQPDPTLLQAARTFFQHLAPADARHVAIIGTGQRTVTGIAVRRGEFSYDVTSLGDGTVAAASARLAGASAYYLRCEHSELPRSAPVAAAVLDILKHGVTRKLTTHWRARPTTPVRVSDTSLRRTLGQKLDWQTMSALQRHVYLSQLNRPPANYFTGR